MTRSTAIALLSCLLVTPLLATADPHKNESGHGRGHAHSYKEEFWLGNCKIERKFKKDGDYKEERKCHGPEAYGYAPAVVVMPPGIVIQGTVRLP